jgi:hypothetical protein
MNDNGGGASLQCAHDGGGWKKFMGCSTRMNSGAVLQRTVSRGSDSVRKDPDNSVACGVEAKKNR